MLSRDRVQIIDLHYQIGAQTLFRGLHAHFSQGIISIRGENGCGKSTLLRILSGLCQPDKGKVCYQDKNIYESHLVKKIIGYVASQPFLYPHLSINENLFVVAAMRGIDPNSLKANLESVLNLCQLTPYVKQLFGKCSDGLQKRAMLASALVHQPQLLILDEPCAGLSPKNRALLWEILKNIQTQGTDIILSSHLDEVMAFCQEGYVLENGQLRLISSPQKFSEIVLTQNTSLPNHPQKAQTKP